MDLKEFYNAQSEDVKAKLKACDSEEEMMKVLEEEQIELDPEILSEVSGGGKGGGGKITGHHSSGGLC